MIDTAVLVHFGLLLLRGGMLIVTAPVFGGTWAPGPIKIGLTAILAVVLFPVVEIPAIPTAGGLAVVAAREAAIGVALGMAIRVLVGGVELAGYLSGFQIGFSIAAIVDPQSGVRNNLLALLYGSLALVTFFGVDGHHAMLRALVASYEAIPIGAGGVGASMVDVVTRMLGVLFTLGAQLAAPVVIVLLVLELGMGLFSRAAPALNLMVIGFPLRLLVGLMALSLSIQVVPRVVSGLVEPALELATGAALALR